MHVPVIRTIALLFLLTTTAIADEPNLRTRWGGAFYGYANSTSLQDESVLNPGNELARLPQRSDTAEARFNLKVEKESLRLTMRPIALLQNDRNNFGSEQRNEAYLSQWQLRLHMTEAWSVSVGREVLNWGPAQFRSPSSPFYFDNGRSNPMRELSGLDAARVVWAPDVHTTVYVARVDDSGHNASEAWRDSGLLKLDWRSDEWAGGVALAKQPGRSTFLGAHLQQTLSDALLVYGEAGSSTRENALLSPSDLTQPFIVVDESERHTNLLFGAAYSLENGQSLAAEYLRHGHGYGTDEIDAFFNRAAASPSAAAIALGTVPPLLGHDYLHLVWQSSPMATEGYWRLMLTRNLNAGGSEMAGYGEYTFSTRISAFALAVLPIGSERQEFSILFSRSVTAGLKLALP